MKYFTFKKKAMKFTPYIIAATLLLVSCNKSQEKEIEVEPLKLPTAEKAAFECFELKNEGDTITLKISHHAGEVGGDLVYKWRERDRNVGTISGRFSGDTLIADYTFESEGMTSIREAVFVRKGNTLVQGHGEMEEKNDIMIFKNKSNLIFDNSIVLTEVECN